MHATPSDSSHENLESAEYDDVGEDPNESHLMEFLACWEDLAEAPDRDALLERFCANFPHLAADFRTLAEIRGGIGRLDFIAGTPDSDPGNLGPYRIIRLLGCGGMGKVFEAEDTTLSRRVAIKTIRVGRLAEPKLLERFKAEREALAILHNTNIVPIFNAGEEDGLLYFAMPLIRGHTLQDLLDSVIQPVSPSAHTVDARSSLSSWADLLKLANSRATHRQTLQRLSARCGLRLSGATTLGQQSSDMARQTPNPPSPARPPDYERRVAEILAVAAEAVHSAHEAGVLHFDIKPANILVEPIAEGAESRETGKSHEPVTPSRNRFRTWWSQLRLREERQEDRTSVHPWVIDFGLADVPRQIGDPASPDEHRPGAQRSQGFGTKGFMAPEMLTHRAVAFGMPPASETQALGRRTDVWSLGVTLYQLLTLRMPFQTDRQVTDSGDPPPSPRFYVRRIDGELEAVVMKALKKPPEQRYASAGEFASDLRRWLGGYPTEAGRKYPGRHLYKWIRRHPFAAGMTAAFLLMASMGAGQTVRVVRQDLAAKQRELDLFAVARLQAPVRLAGWFETAWGKLRDSAKGRSDEDGQFQARFASLLANLDARESRKIPIEANQLAFSPDGTRLLIAEYGQDGASRPTTRVMVAPLEVQAPSLETRFEGHGVVGFGPGSEPRYLESDPVEVSKLRLRDALTGAEIRTFESPRAGTSAVKAHAMSRDGTHVAAVIRPVRKRTPEELAAAPAESPWAVAGDEATIVVWNLAEGSIVWRSDEMADARAEIDVALAPDGKHVAAWDRKDGASEVQVWDVAARASIGRFASNRSRITAVSFGPDPVWRDDGKPSRPRLAIGENGGMITVWNLETRAVQCQARGSKYQVNNIDFSRDGTSMVSVGNRDLKIWNPATGICLLNVIAGNLQNAVALSADARRVAVATAKDFGSFGIVQIFDLEQGRGIRTLGAFDQRVEKIVISADGRRIAALSQDWQVALYEKDTGALLGIVEAPQGEYPDNAALVLNGAGTRLLCSAGTGAKLYDVDAKRLIRNWNLPPALTEAAGFRQDGRIVLIRQETRDRKHVPDSRAPAKEHPRVCRAYELADQGEPRLLTEIPDFDWYVEHIDATRDFSYFAIQGVRSRGEARERLVQVYDGATGKPLGSIPTRVPADRSATSMRFDPSGTRLGLFRAFPQTVYDVFEIPGLRLTGSIEASEFSTLAAGGSRWIGRVPPLLEFHENGRPDPFLRIELFADVNLANAIKFAPDGDHVVWGDSDGDVSICDLDEVRRRLAAVGLGW